MGVLREYWPHARLSFIVLVLVLTTWDGVVDGLSAARLATTPAVRLAAILQLLCGVSAGGALFSMVMEPARVFPILMFWGIVLVASSATARFVAGGTPLIEGIIAGLAGGAVAALVVWGWSVHLQNERGSVT